MQHRRDARGHFADVDGMVVVAPSVQKPVR